MDISQLIEDIFNKAITPGNIDKNTARQITIYLQQALLKGYKSSFTDLPFGSPKLYLLAQLHYDVAIFSAFKNHSQIQDTIAALTDSKGNVRSFAQFRRAATHINNKYNKAWLRAEYQTALLQGNAATKWQQILDGKHLYPNLRYSAVQDACTRPQHRQWDWHRKTH